MAKFRDRMADADTEEDVLEYKEEKRPKTMSWFLTDHDLLLVFY